MHEITNILGDGFGDGVPHYKEEAYNMLCVAYGTRWTIKTIDKHVKKYIEYGLLKGVKDKVFRGYYKWQITDKGIQALDYYRNARGYKDLSKGAMY
jgi:hypothetical protein